MGQITAIYNDPSITSPDKRRQVGMRKLGQEIEANTKISDPTSPPKQLLKFYVDGLATAMQNVLSPGIITTTIMFTNTVLVSDGSGGKKKQTQTFELKNPTPNGGSTKIDCELWQNGNHVGALKLNVKVEDAKDSAGKKYSMDVVFPDAEDNGEYEYLDEPAQDIIDLGVAVKGNDYLKVFKFLGRCK